MLRLWAFILTSISNMLNIRVNKVWLSKMIHDALALLLLFSVSEISK